MKKNWGGERLEGSSVGTGEGRELLASVKRLTRIVLDRLEKGSREGTLDQGQVRMLGSIALRSMRLWKETLISGEVGQAGLRELLEAEDGLSGKLPGKEGDEA